MSHDIKLSCGTRADINSVMASYLNLMSWRCSLTCRRSTTSLGLSCRIQLTKAGDTHGAPRCSSSSSGRMNPAATHLSNSSATKARSLLVVGYGRNRRRGRPRGVSHGSLKPNCRARRTQREAPISRQASAASLARCAGGKPGTAPLLVFPVAPYSAARGASGTPRVPAPFLGRCGGVAATLPPSAAPPPLTPFGRDVLDLRCRDALVEPAVAEVERLDFEVAAGLGGVRVGRGEHPVLELGCDDGFELLKHVLPGSA